MGRRTGVVVLVLLALLVVAFIFMAIRRQRATHDQVACLNNFRELGQFAAMYEKNGKLKEKREPKLDNLAVPAGTLFHSAYPPDQRLSWIADSLDAIDQRGQKTGELAKKLDRAGMWDSERNREVAFVPLKLFLCPGAIPDLAANEPAPAQIVGLGGIGPDGATLDLGPPVPNRAGCFRYDSPTPLPTIRDGDGLSSTLLFGDTRADLGPWIRGGPSTVRMLDVLPTAAPIFREQFGGNYPHVAAFGIADGGARFFSDRMNPDVIRAMFTIRGAGEDPLVGE